MYRATIGSSPLEGYLQLHNVSLSDIIYSYGDTNNGEVEIECRMDGEATLLIDIQDTGVPFDILAVPDPDIQSGISERKIGGLGILFIKKMIDEVKYRREGKCNILTFVVHKKKG